MRWARKDGAGNAFDLPIVWRVDDITVIMRDELVLQLVSAGTQFDKIGVTNAESNLRVSGGIDCELSSNHSGTSTGQRDLLREFSGEF